MSSRTSLRLQLMREQSMQQDQQQHKNTTASDSNPVYIRMAGGGGNGGIPGGSSLSSSNKSSPIIIQQPIRFTGKQLVHLPPQIIHVQSQGEDDRRGFSGSAPNHLTSQDFVGTPPKVFKQDGYGTPQQGSRNSPAELSPPGYADSPHSQHSASFTSAQSEIDDIHIIDEILSLEDEQNLRRQQNRDELPSSYTFSNDLPTGGSRPVSIAGGHAVAFTRQVSSSAPSSSVDIEGLVKQEIIREQEFDRDRRKKDIHNMIERRRRYNINDRIKELGMILPKSAADDLKMNKGTILKASVDYIRQLQREHENLIRTQQKQSQLETQNRLMMQRIKELERHLQSHGVPVPSGQSLPVVLEQPSAPPPAHTSREQDMVGKPIKLEPLDDIPCAGAQAQGSPHRLPPQASPKQVEALNHSPALPHQAAPSPSFSTVMEFSQLALDSHRYAAPPPPHLSQIPSHTTGVPNSVASLFGAVMGDTLETPPVLPGTTHKLDEQFVKHQVSEFSMEWNPNVKLSRATPHFPHPHSQMSELMMEDGHGSNSPLLHPGDPMLSATGRAPTVAQLSPVQWDAATFSPDGGPGPENRMDMTS